jgi:hypothetical protein
LFALPETQKREPKKTTDEASKPTKVTAKGYLEAKRAQNVWIMAKNLMKNNLDIERLEHAIYNVDLADLSYDIMANIKEHMVQLLCQYNIYKKNVLKFTFIFEFTRISLFPGYTR